MNGTSGSFGHFIRGPFLITSLMCRPSAYRSNVPATLESLALLDQLKVRKTTRVFLVVFRDGKDGPIKFITSELLKSHSGCDRGKHRDIWRTNGETLSDAICDSPLKCISRGTQYTPTQACAVDSSGFRRGTQPWFLFQVTLFEYNNHISVSGQKGK